MPGTLRSRRLAPEGWQPQPWKNGGGITHELVRWPDEADFEVRISVAEVTVSGAFSTFPRFERYSVALAGGPLDLTTTAGTARLRSRELLRFAGEEPIYATVSGEPATLLNILARPGVVDVGIGACAGASFVFALSDTPRLARWHACVFESAEAVDGDVVWVARRAVTP